MSLNKFTSQLVPQPYLNPRFNSMKLDAGADFSGSSIVDLLDINGVPVDSLIGMAQRAAIIYRPGAPQPPAPTNIITTWAAVVAAVDESFGALTLYIDDSKVSPAPASSSLNGYGRLVIKPYQCRDGSPSHVTLLVANGAVFTDIASIEGPINVQCICISGSTFAFSYNWAILNLQQMANLVNDATSTKPLFIVPDGQEMALIQDFSSQLTTLGAVKPVNVGVGSTLVLLQQNFYQNVLWDYVTSSDATATLLILHDSSIDIQDLSFVGFTGTIISEYTCAAYAVKYDDTVTLPALSASSVQAAIDVLKTTYLPKSGGSLTGVLKAPVQPHYIATASTTQHVTGVADLTIWDTLVEAVGITQSAPGQFTVPQAGYYLLQMGAGVETKDAFIYFTVNASALAIAASYGYTTLGSGACSSSITLKLNANDVVHTVGASTSASADIGTLFSGFGFSNLASMSIWMIG